MLLNTLVEDIQLYLYFSFYNVGVKPSSVGAPVSFVKVLGNDFDSVVKSDANVLVEFYAPWFK